MITAPDRPPDVEVTLVRILGAPRELVWKAWTDPKRLAEWWGPKGFTNPVCEFDVRRGGGMRIHKRAPDGGVLPLVGVFREIDPPQRLVFSFQALKEADGEVRFEGFTIVTCEELGRETKLTVESIAIALTSESSEIIKGMDEGWSQSLDRLAILVTA